MANIFGQKELAEKTQVKVENDDRILQTEASGFRDDWYGVNTINSGNMTDYFKSKYNNMSDYLKCNVNSTNDTSLSNNMTENQMTDSENENDQHVGLGFTQKMEDTSLSSCGVLKNSEDKSNYAFDNPCLGLNSPTETACETNGSSKSTKSTKKRKKEFESDSLQTIEINKHNIRKKLKTETIESDCKNGFINPALNLDTNPEEDYNGKEFEVFRTQFGLENCGLDLTDERNDKKRVTFNDHIMLYEYNINSAKNKKGEATLDKFEVKNKKSKKKRKYESTTIPVTNGFVNEALDIQVLHEEINDNELNEHKNKKTKKRKIYKTSSLETIQESPEKEIIEIDIESEDTLDTSIVEIRDTNTELEQKSKKKKKKKEKEEKRTKVEDITVLRVINKKTGIEIEEAIRNKKIKKNKENKEEDVVISKKCKKKKKKEKENCKNEKYTIQTEINDEQQDIQILNKSDSKQQNDHLTENKDVAIIEILPILKTKEEGKEEEKIKHKKKKRKSQEGIISKEDHPSQNDVCSVEKEISNKENTDKEHDPNIKKLAKKDKKNKKLKDKNISNVEDSFNSNKEFIDANDTKQDKIENAEFTDTPSKKSKMIDTIDNILNSPWNVKTRMSKKTLITLFHNDAILEFPGSNIHNIKGYGTDLYEL